MKRTSTYKTRHSPLNLTRALCIITLLIDGARKGIRLTNPLHNLAVVQRSHIQHLQLMLADNKINIEKETAYFHNVTLYMPMPAKAHSNRITNDFALEIDRITDILHDNTGYKWIDNTE